MVPRPRDNVFFAEQRTARATAHKVIGNQAAERRNIGLPVGSEPISFELQNLFLGLRARSSILGIERERSAGESGKSQAKSGVEEIHRDLLVCNDGRRDGRNCSRWGGTAVRVAGLDRKQAPVS